MGVQVLSALPCLAALQLNGNPVVSKIPQYRRTVIGRCKSLTYLDDRPVFEDERLTVEAWLIAPCAGRVRRFHQFFHPCRVTRLQGGTRGSRRRLLALTEMPEHLHGNDFLSAKAAQWRNSQPAAPHSLKVRAIEGAPHST